MIWKSAPKAKNLAVDLLALHLAADDRNDPAHAGADLARPRSPRRSGR
jgi:hypothetical protein